MGICGRERQVHDFSTAPLPPAVRVRKCPSKVSGCGVTPSCPSGGLDGPEQDAAPASLQTLDILRDGTNGRKTSSQTRTAGRRAVFLDRDGVLTEPVWNPATGEYESPHVVDDLRFCPDVLALRELCDRGIELFIVSNQPSHAKGKALFEDIRAIARAVEDRFREVGIVFRDAYYCYHHPRGVVPTYTRPCPCRKPEPYFLRVAAERYGIDLRRSWMVGDRDSDVECGRRAGCRTILITHPHARDHQRTSQPDYLAHDVAAAVAAIVADAARSARYGAGRTS